MKTGAYASVFLSYIEYIAGGSELFALSNSSGELTRTNRGYECE